MFSCRGYINMLLVSQMAIEVDDKYVDTLVVLAQIFVIARTIFCISSCKGIYMHSSD